MNVQRRLQLIAAVVIVNSLGAMSLVSSNVAFANPCGSQVVACLVACTGQVASALCPSVAQPGCTYTSFNCYPDVVCGMGWMMECRYD